MKDKVTQVHTTKEGGVYIEMKDLLSKPSVKDMINLLSRIMYEVNELKYLSRKKKTINTKSLTFSDGEQQRRKAYKYEF